MLFSKYILYISLVYNSTFTKSRSAVICFSPTEEEKVASPAPIEKLPPPDFIDTSSTSNLPKTSVFTNPFKEAENAKQAILEKHVKMVNTQENVRIINGKKVCWNYRKGRCRFGHNCIYAHDSDIQKSKEQLEAENQVQQTVLYESQQYSKVKKDEAKQSEDSVMKGKKKRPGLTQGLIPGKKVMKAYHDQHIKSIPTSTNK